MRSLKSSGALGCALLVALAAGFCAPAAVAADKPVSAAADTQAKSAHAGVLNVGAVHWTCKDTAKDTHCSATPVLSAVASPVQACEGLARAVGAIRSFKIANKALNAKALQQCNSVVASTRPTAPRAAAPNAGPDHHRLITANDFPSLVQPLPDAPYRVKASRD